MSKGVIIYRDLKEYDGRVRVVANMQDNPRNILTAASYVGQIYPYPSIIATLKIFWSKIYIFLWSFEFSRLTCCDEKSKSESMYQKMWVLTKNSRSRHKNPHTYSLWPISYENVDILKVHIFHRKFWPKRVNFHLKMTQLLN